MDIFLKYLIEVLNYLGYGATILVIFASIRGLRLWLKGVLPIIYRLGVGLSTRKIAIFAKGDNLKSLEQLLCDSKIFNKNNIINIAMKDDFGRAEKASVYLMHWNDFGDCINNILQKKPDSCPLIVYSPYELERIPPEQMMKLDGHRNTAVTNFRGRLLNDVVTSMITTAYEKK